MKPRMQEKGVQLSSASTLQAWRTIFTEFKFMYLTHSEAKQTNTLDSKTEKGLFQDHARRTSGSCTSESLNFLKNFSKACVKAR